MESSISRHIVSDHPRVLVVDGSKVVRRLIEQVLNAELSGVSVVGCGSGAEARAALEKAPVDFVTTALRLPDMDGLELARSVRMHAPQAYVPIVVVSGDVNERLQARALGEDVTDYFDKSLASARWPSSFAAMCSRRARPAATCCTSRTAASSPWPPGGCSRNTD